MTLATYTIDDLVAYDRRYGASANPPPIGALAVIAPPAADRCHVCGVPVPKSAKKAAHAVAGFEHALHPESGEPLRLLVAHCREHEGADHCRRDRETPGSGLVGVPGGFCEPLSTVAELGVALFPGARIMGHLVKLALGGGGLYVLGSLAVVRSRGQATADFQGPVSSLLYPGTATSGQGLNAGQWKVYTGSAPATGDAAETGTLLISWVLPATAMGAPSAATPPVCTFAAISNVNAAATGTAGYSRINANGDDGTLSTTQRRYQITVGAGSGDLSMNTTAVTNGGAASITAATFTAG